jgi:FtsH-binding integral membrane protein
LRETMSDNPNNIFPNMRVADESVNLQVLTEVIHQSTTQNMLNKTYWARMISAIAARLSLIASVWLFIFDHQLWYGIPLFFVLVLIYGEVKDIKETK